MQKLLSNIQIKVPENTYLKDPEGSELGRKILTEAIRQLDELGLESFNFKKLAESIETTEASVYRYFENKHKLLLYLNAWYWAWLEYRIAFGTANVAEPQERLKRTLLILVNPVTPEHSTQYIDLAALYRVVIAESSKSYFTRSVDEDNRKKLFSTYKSLIISLAEILQELNPAYQHTRSLAATIVDSILHQSFYGAHLKSLNDIGIKPEDMHTFFYRLALGTLKYDS